MNEDLQRVLVVTAAVLVALWINRTFQVDRMLAA
jgi:hypothetical protein